MVMFGAPDYTFNETGVEGTIEVVKMGVTIEDFSVRVFGGMYSLPLCTSLTSRIATVSLLYKYMEFDWDTVVLLIVLEWDNKEYN